MCSKLRNEACGKLNLFLNFLWKSAFSRSGELTQHMSQNFWWGLRLMCSPFSLWCLIIRCFYLLKTFPVLSDVMLLDWSTWFIRRCLWRCRRCTTNLIIQLKDEEEQTICCELYDCKVHGCYVTICDRVVGMFGMWFECTIAFGQKHNHFWHGLEGKM